MVASKLLEVGKFLLLDESSQDRTLESRAAEAIPWIQKSYGMIDALNDETVAGLAEMKVRNVTPSSALLDAQRIVAVLSSEPRCVHLVVPEKHTLTQ